MPGTFIKWFLKELGLGGLCRLIDDKDRSAVASCIFGYFDGEIEKYFEGSLPGWIAEKPTGNGGFGWDKIFIPEGYTVTRAELSKDDDAITYLKIKPFAELKEYLSGLSR